MTIKTAGLLLGLAMLGVLAFGFWYQQRHPRQVIAVGEIRVESKVRPGPMVLATRTVAIGPRRIQEVAMPNGTWIDCAGDCRKAALEAGPDFWDALSRRSR